MTSEISFMTSVPVDRPRIHLKPILDTAHTPGPHGDALGQLPLRIASHLACEDDGVTAVHHIDELAADGLAPQDLQHDPGVEVGMIGNPVQRVARWRIGGRACRRPVHHRSSPVVLLCRGRGRDQCSEHQNDGGRRTAPREGHPCADVPIIHDRSPLV